ncbi:MAG: hypothetical protein ACOYMB_00485 [Patescibacteria group bacterium]
MSNSMYEKLGVDPTKSSVKEIFHAIIDNEYPGAFVNIITDPFCPERVLTQHQDGDGSKFVQRVLHYFENNDPAVFAGMVDDALSMNTGDIAASGFVAGPILVTNVLNLNFPKEIKKIIMKVIALRMLELKEIYRGHGFDLRLLGGETADLPDQVRTGVFDIAVTAWANRSQLIKGNVESGDLIFGFPSDEQAAWETKSNSGIMSNGLTLARSSLMHSSYNKTYGHLKRGGDYYNGKFFYNDCSVPLGMSVGDALISPTRQWAIVIKEIISALEKEDALFMLHGISMNTGGGATKISNIGQGNILYIKNMPPPPPLFRLIQCESNESWENMYQILNCGIGIDVVGKNHPVFKDALKEAALKCDLPLYQLGVCEKMPREPKNNQVLLSTPFGEFRY